MSDNTVFEFLRSGDFEFNVTVNKKIPEIEYTDLGVSVVFGRGDERVGFRFDPDGVRDVEFWFAEGFYPLGLEEADAFSENLLNAVVCANEVRRELDRRRD